MISARDRLCSGILIFADESAEWRCCGLRQIDRLLLALNELVSGSHDTGLMPVCISWPANGQRSLPEHSRLGSLSISDEIEKFSLKVEDCAQPASEVELRVLVVSTRLVICGAADKSRLFAADERAPILSISTTDLRESWPHLLERLRESERAALERMPTNSEPSDWFCYLDSERDISLCEKRLLHATAKPQDGLIARFVNRPVSRSLSRFLVRLPLSPNHWTLLLTAIPIAGAIFLIQGDYLGFALGAILFQLHSTLDGCDGEIARLKYLESNAGHKLDQVCDRFASLLYAVSLGFGLARQPDTLGWWMWIYPWEGAIAAVLIGVSETLLTRIPLETISGPESERNNVAGYLREHGQSFNRGDQVKLWIIRNSRMLTLGAPATRFFGELTKRDVFNFIFMVMIICGRPSWVLHIVALCACGIMIIALKNLLTKPVLAGHAPLS